MAKTKLIKKSTPQLAKGGTKHMFGQQHAGPQVPGQTAAKDKSTGGKFAKGGGGHMFGRQTASPRRPGVTGK
jgi:hypothetical protein